MTIRTLTISYVTIHEVEIDLDDFTLSDDELTAFEQKELEALGLDYDQESDPKYFRFTT